MKKTNKNTNMGMALGMLFGMVIGLLLGASKDKKINDQIEEDNYTIKEIKKNEQKEEYIITIVDKSGEEREVIVPKGQMEEENFSKADVVYLDEDGMIEQA